MICFLNRCLKQRSKSLHSLFVRVWGLYEGLSKRFRTGCLERELHMVQFSVTRCSFTAILWVSLVSFAAKILCVSSQRVFIVVVIHFVIDSVRKLLDTPSYKKLGKWLSTLPLAKWLAFGRIVRHSLFHNKHIARDRQTFNFSAHFKHTVLIRFATPMNAFIAGSCYVMTFDDDVYKYDSVTLQIYGTFLSRVTSTRMYPKVSGLATLSRVTSTRVYSKVSGLATWSENCKWYSSLPLGTVILLFCKSVWWVLRP
jgi:hypothetical protein